MVLLESQFDSGLKRFLVTSHLITNHMATNSNFQVGEGYSVDLSAYHDAVITHQLDAIRDNVFGNDSTMSQEELRSLYDTLLRVIDAKSNIVFNISNHPSAKWSKEQIAACNNAVICDIPFPNVNPEATAYELDASCFAFADWLTSLTQGMDKTRVTFHIAGQQGALFRIVGFLKMGGYNAVFASSKRIVETHEDNSKTIRFEFTQFTSY